MCTRKAYASSGAESTHEQTVLTSVLRSRGGNEKPCAYASTDMKRVGTPGFKWTVTPLVASASAAPANFSR